MTVTAANNSVPAGYKWIRELFPNISWDQLTKTATIAGGPSFNASQGILRDGKLYMKPETLGQGYANHTPQSSLTPENVQNTAATLKQLQDPFLKALQARIDQRTKSIEAQAEAQRRTAEAAYTSGISNLDSQKENTMTKAMKQARNSAVARGLYSSGLYDELQQNERSNVENTYAPSYQSLEANKAATIANIGSESALALDELALQGNEQEYQLEGDLLSKAFSMLQGQDTEAKSKAQKIAEWLFGLGEQDYNRGQDLQEATGYYTDPTTGQQQPTMDRWYKEQMLANDRFSNETSRMNATNEPPGTQTDRKNTATTTLLKAGLQRYDQLRKSGKYKYPLYYTVSSMLRDPSLAADAIESGADVIRAVDALIMSIAKKSPEQYFSSGTGAKLKDFYYTLKGKSGNDTGIDINALVNQQMNQN